ncbi:MAG: hypothetical protein JXB36_14885, partial [Gammaproteobacteria bacterium]|nr:hypothetical protein [Gammaproteobacteria bacterium]
MRRADAARRVGAGDCLYWRNLRQENDDDESSTENGMARRLTGRGRGFVAAGRGRAAVAAGRERAAVAAGRERGCVAASLGRGPRVAALAGLALLAGITAAERLAAQALEAPAASAPALELAEVGAVMQCSELLEVDAVFTAADLTHLTSATVVTQSGKLPYCRVEGYIAPQIR